MDDEVFAILLGCESMHTVRTAQFKRRMPILNRRKPGLTDFTHDLAFGAVVLIQIDFRSVATRAFTVVIDIAFRTTFYRLDWFVIILVTPCIVSHEIFVIPGLNIQDQRERIDFQLLISGGTGVIISPLLERDVSTDKVNQPAVLLIEMVDDFK